MGMQVPGVNPSQPEGGNDTGTVEQQKADEAIGQMRALAQYELLDNENETLKSQWKILHDLHLRLLIDKSQLEKTRDQLQQQQQQQQV